ncbi:MAG: hypothetical protein C0476_05190 [Sphingomonas sp.]|nr:hypothetical protein [Sphingomonas sp.]
MALVAAIAPAPAREKSGAANPIAYVEIPVTNMDRAMAFYTELFGFDFVRETIDGYDVALFPAVEGGAGASGALVKGDVYVPGKTGPIVYFRIADIDAVLKLARARGAKILYEKKNVGAFGFVAEIEDSEGNRIALSAPK